MPGLKKYPTTEDLFTSEDRKSSREKQFPDSPLYDESYNHDALIKIANELMFTSVEGQDIDYTDSPSWDEVRVVVEEKKGRDGYPSTPWTPNRASPGSKGIGETNVSTHTIPEIIEDPTDINPNFVEGSEGTVDPSESSKEISSTLLGKSLIKGKHPQKS